MFRRPCQHLLTVSYWRVITSGEYRLIATVCIFHKKKKKKKIQRKSEWETENERGNVWDWNARSKEIDSNCRRPLTYTAYSVPWMRTNLGHSVAISLCMCECVSSDFCLLFPPFYFCFHAIASDRSTSLNKHHVFRVGILIFRLSLSLAHWLSFFLSFVFAYSTENDSDWM